MVLVTPVSSVRARYVLVHEHEPPAAMPEVLKRERSKSRDLPNEEQQELPVVAAAAADTCPEPATSLLPPQLV